MKGEVSEVKVMCFRFLAWSPEDERALRILSTQAYIMQLVPGSSSTREPALSVEMFICVISSLLGPSSSLVMTEVMLLFNTRGNFSDLMKSHQHYVKK